jgi:hypothetical protein
VVEDEESRGGAQAKRSVGFRVARTRRATAGAEEDRRVLSKSEISSKDVTAAL